MRAFHLTLGLALVLALPLVAVPASAGVNGLPALEDVEAATVLTFSRPLHEECIMHVCRDRALLGGEGRRAFDLGDATSLPDRDGLLEALEMDLAERLAGKQGPPPARLPASYAPKLVPAASLPPSLPFRAPIPRPEPQPAPVPPPASAPAPIPAPVTRAAVVEGPAAPEWHAPERAAAIALVVAALAAYSRITTRNAALSSPVRAKILEVVQREGVIALPKLADALQLGRTTIEHHLRVLERCAILSVSREGRAVLVSLPGVRATAPPPEVRRSPAAQALLAILAARPDGLPREELHRAAATIPLRTRNHAIRALAQHGLIVENGDRVVAARSQP